MFSSRNRYIIALMLLMIFLISIFILFYIIQISYDDNKVVRIGLRYEFYLYYIEITNTGKVKLEAGFESHLPIWYAPSFLGDTQFKYETTLSEVDIDRIFSLADEMCRECELIEKPNNYNFEVPPHEAFIMYKQYKINHYLDTGEAPKEIPILQEFVELVKEKTEFVPVSHGGHWKVVNSN